jgi:hypothetical protein
MRDRMNPMPDSLKVPRDKFEALVRALLNMPPMPLADIPRKREPKPYAKGGNGEEAARAATRKETAANHSRGCPSSIPTLLPLPP